MRRKDVGRQMGQIGKKSMMDDDVFFFILVLIFS